MNKRHREKCSRRDKEHNLRQPEQHGTLFNVHNAFSDTSTTIIVCDADKRYKEY